MMENLVPAAIGLFAIFGADWMVRERNRGQNLNLSESDMRHAAIVIRAIGVVALWLAGGK